MVLIIMAKDKSSTSKPNVTSNPAIAPNPDIKSLSEWMLERNKSYYQSPSTAIHEDFSTYAQSPQGLLTRANARAFHSYAKKNGRNRYDVLEAGVGEGAFAHGFLEELKALDKSSKTDIASRVHYTLADFSETMMKKAFARLESAGFKGQIHSVTWDASDPESDPFGFSTFQLIRCNELFDDLPADAFVQQDGEIHSVLFDGNLKPHIQPAQTDELDEVARKLLLVLPQNYIMPFNQSALDSIDKLLERLDPRGMFDIFDYGFYRADDFALPPEMWNLNVIREYNSQWTVDLNFLYLSIQLAQEDHSVLVEPQADYVKSLMGNEMADVRITDGLDYGKEQDDGNGVGEDSIPIDAKEDDFFYHLAVKSK